MIPKRRKREPLGLREAPQIRCRGHLQWVRGHECVVSNSMCAGNIEACHVRSGTDGGMGVKPSDRYVFPGCTVHHAEQHRIGEQQFARKYSINLRQIADGLWLKSPHGKKWRMEQ